MNKLEQYTIRADMNIAAAEMSLAPHGRALNPEILIDSARDVQDLLNRLDIAIAALEQCKCVSMADEGTLHYPAQEALGRIRGEE